MPKETWKDGIFREYHRGTKVLKQIVDCQYSSELPDHIYQAWNQTFVTMRLADDALDNCKDRNEREELVTDALACLSGEQRSLEGNELGNQLELLRTTLDSFSSLQKENYINTLKRICQVTEQIKRDNNVASLSKHVRLEGHLTSRLFLGLLPSSYKESSKFKSLVISMTRLGRFGNSLDSFLDLKDDYKNGEVKIIPSNTNRTSLVTMSSSDLLSAIRNLRFNTFLKLGAKFASRLV